MDGVFAGYLGVSLVSISDRIPPYPAISRHIPPYPAISRHIPPRIPRKNPSTPQGFLQWYSSKSSSSVASFFCECPGRKRSIHGREGRSSS